jgi:hypothetical protein
MWHEGQGQMDNILDGWHDWTKPYKGLQVQVLHNEAWNVLR